MCFKAFCCVAKRVGREPHPAAFYFTVCVPPIAGCSRFLQTCLWHGMRSTGDAVVDTIGPLPHGNEFQHIAYMRRAVDHDKAPLIFSYSGFFWFMTMFYRWMLWARFPLLDHL